jgi:hypothetical protein
MPYSMAHPAAAVPLTRLGLPLSPLVVGSVGPDIWTLLGPAMHNFGHTFLGIFLFCVPFGVFSLWCFHRVLKPMFLDLLPADQRQRFTSVAPRFSFGPKRRFCLITSSLVLGALTHIIWDSFTHSYGWPVHQLAILRAGIPLASAGPIPVYKVLHHASTLVGMTLLVYWFHRWFKGTSHTVYGTVSMRRKALLYISMVPTAVIITGVYGYLSLPVPPGPRGVQLFVTKLMLAGWGLVLAQFSIISFALHWKYPKHVSIVERSVCHKTTSTSGLPQVAAHDYEPL